jgi:hypothetical protein
MRNYGLDASCPFCSESLIFPYLFSKNLITKIYKKQFYMFFIGVKLSLPH